LDGRAGTDIDMFDSIATLLMALAGLAERAAGRSWPLRWLALWALRRAETVARDFVAGSGWSIAGRRWTCALPAARRIGDPDDAMRLAAALRALARAVCAMAAHLRRRARQTTQQASRNTAIGAEAGIARNGSFAPFEPSDTS
jgi:hypothetical protein